MARIVGIDSPHDKRVVVPLTCIYGISRSTSEKILAEAGISEDIRIKDLTGDQVNTARNKIDGVKVEDDLRREVRLGIKRLMKIGCYRGIHHGRGSPVRGQRTKTNARTCKSPVCTVANERR